jgi:curved DNA-binding protein CbpA
MCIIKFIEELPVSASSEMIREAFRRLSKKYHPDRNPKSKDRF